MCEIPRNNASNEEIKNQKKICTAICIFDMIIFIIIFQYFSDYSIVLNLNKLNSEKGNK